MTLKVALVDNKTGQHLKSAQVWLVEEALDAAADVLITESTFREHGAWKAAQIVTATTTTITAPAASGSLVVTDIVVSAKKVNNTTLDIEFDDGANTEIIISPDTINNPVNFSWSPGGRIQGWKDAALKVVTGGAGTPSVSITVGYLKVPTGLPFTEWDALR